MRVGIISCDLLSQERRTDDGLQHAVLRCPRNPTTTDRDVGRRVLALLEDRRVPYDPPEVDMAEHCVESIFDIRRFLTEVIGHLTDHARRRAGPRILHYESAPFCSHDHRLCLPLTAGCETVWVRRVHTAGPPEF